LNDENAARKGNRHFRPPPPAAVSGALIAISPKPQRYLSSQISSNRQPLYWLLVIIVRPLSSGCQQVGPDAQDLAGACNRRPARSACVLPGRPPSIAARPSCRILIAIARVIACRAAHVVLREIDIGIVYCRSQDVEPDLEVLADQLWDPVGRFDRLELAVYEDLLQLVTIMSQSLRSGACTLSFRA
jgi:hypothetical protein